ncbi:hypothetical protein SDC9_102920 [bioreactor metagenome]|uniref:Uncharacterized protein n=1 Tax=bioreactor metagenome TaxID=1076179 RepID=A0A645AUZ5_9ZZZZ
MVGWRDMVTFFVDVVEWRASHAGRARSPALHDGGREVRSEWRGGRIRRSRGGAACAGADVACGMAVHTVSYNIFDMVEAGFNA